MIKKLVKPQEFSDDLISSKIKFFDYLYICKKADFIYKWCIELLNVEIQNENFNFISTIINFLYKYIDKKDVRNEIERFLWEYPETNLSDPIILEIHKILIKALSKDDLKEWAIKIITEYDMYSSEEDIFNNENNEEQILKYLNNEIFHNENESLVISAIETLYEVDNTENKEKCLLTIFKIARKSLLHKYSKKYIKNNIETELDYFYNNLKVALSEFLYQFCLLKDPKIRKKILSCANRLYESIPQDESKYCNEILRNISKIENGLKLADMFDKPNNKEIESNINLPNNIIDFKTHIIKDNIKKVSHEKVVTINEVKNNKLKNLKRYGETSNNNKANIKDLKDITERYNFNIKEIFGSGEIEISYKGSEEINQIQIIFENKVEFKDSEYGEPTLILNPFRTGKNTFKTPCLKVFKKVISIRVIEDNTKDN